MQKLMISRSRYALALYLTLFSFAANAHMVKSGTGFFISKSGHILTNEHVVSGCDTVEIRGAVKPTQAKVIKTDSLTDLALLKTAATPSRFVSFRSSHGYKLKEGDPVMVIGYPEEHGISGEYFVKQSRINTITGDSRSDKWIEFEDASRQGNSGGPLLDESGNVIGVITAKAEIHRVNALSGRSEYLGNTDLAISLPYVWKFIENERIQTNMLYSDIRHNAKYLERLAAETIVNIHCLL